MLYLVRHGHHSTEPVADPVQGPPLTPVGVDQAKLAAKRLGESGYAIDKVLASPMVRSQQTAQAIVDEVKGARLVSLQDLTECTPPMPPALVTGLMSAAELQACAEQFDRVYAAYFRPAEVAESAQVLVAHANVIRYLVTRALGMDARYWQQFSISHGSVTTVRTAADGSIVVYFNANGFPAINELVVSQPEFLKAVDKQIKSTQLPVLKAYAKWNLLNSYADYLSDDFVIQNFDFYGKTLTGAKEMKPRWKRALRETDVAIGEALGQLYVAKHFSANAKKRINELVDNLMSAYKERLSQLEWMSPETRSKALEKLAAIDRKLSFPDTWRDYSKLEIKRESYVQNVMNAQAFLFEL